MASVNKVILIGNLGADPESRFAPSGDAICNITVATTDTWRDKASGEKREATEWHRVAFFGKLAEIAGQRFGPLNLVLVEQPARPEVCRFGLGEDEIRHSRGLITKDEVRAAVLHRLRLPATGVLWDVGGGSGSVSLEAARLCPELSVYTVERNPAEQANIRANIRTYGAYTIHLVDGAAPAALTELPAPDRVFVGGSGGQLEAILTTAAARLAPGGRIVVSAVLAQTETIAQRVLAQLCRHVSCTTLTVTRHDPHGGPDRVLNPITLITGDL